MIVEGSLVLLAATGFVAYVVRGVTGAASAIVFNAVFGLLLTFGLAGGLTLLEGLYWIALGDFLGSVVLVVALRRELRVEGFTIPLLATSVPIAIVATLMLPRLEVELLTLGLGAALVGSGAYLAVRGELHVWDDATLRRRAVPTGLIAGVLSGLYGMAGPVLVVYLAHAGADTRRFRARSTVISATWTTSRFLTLLLSGALGAEGLTRFGLTMPFILAGLGLGMWLHPRFSPRLFRVGLGAIVSLAGVALIVRTVAG